MKEVTYFTKPLLNTPARMVANTREKSGVVYKRIWGVLGDSGVSSVVTTDSQCSGDGGARWAVSAPRECYCEAEPAVSQSLCRPATVATDCTVRQFTVFLTR